MRFARAPRNPLMGLRGFLSWGYEASKMKMRTLISPNQSLRREIPHSTPLRARASLVVRAPLVNSHVPASTQGPIRLPHVRQPARSPAPRLPRPDGIGPGNPVPTDDQWEALDNIDEFELMIGAATTIISHLARCRYAIEGPSGQGGRAH